MIVTAIVVAALGGLLVVLLPPLTQPPVAEKTASPTVQATPPVAVAQQATQDANALAQSPQAATGVMQATYDDVKARAAPYLAQADSEETAAEATRNPAEAAVHFRNAAAGFAEAANILRQSNDPRAQRDLAAANSGRDFCQGFAEFRDEDAARGQGQASRPSSEVPTASSRYRYRSEPGPSYGGPAGQPYRRSPYGDMYSPSPAAPLDPSYRPSPQPVYPSGPSGPDLETLRWQAKAAVEKERLAIDGGGGVGVSQNAAAACRRYGVAMGDPTQGELWATECLSAANGSGSLPDIP